MDGSLSHACRVLALAALLCAMGTPLAPGPAIAANSVPVTLKLDLGPQRAAERQLKALIDEWAKDALDVQFVPRVTGDLAHPDRARVHLDQFAIALSPAWYTRYRAAYATIAAQPFAAEVFQHAAAYCHGGKDRMLGQLLGAGGEVLYAAPVDGLLSMSRSHDTYLAFFLTQRAGILGPETPKVGYLNHASPPEGLFLEVPTATLGRTARIRIVDEPNVRWPVELGP